MIQSLSVCAFFLWIGGTLVSADFINFGMDANLQTQEIHLTVSPQRTDFSVPISVPVFDSTQGTLVEVKIKETVSLNGSAGYTNNAESPSTITLKLSAHTTLQVDGSLMIAEPLINAVVIAPAGMSAILPPAFVTVDKSLILTNANELPHFVGNSGQFILFTFTATGTSTASDTTGNVFVQFNTTAGAMIVVTYVFRPVVSNNAPAVMIQKTVLARRKHVNKDDGKKQMPPPVGAPPHDNKDTQNSGKDKDSSRHGPPGSGPFGMPTMATFAVSALSMDENTTPSQQAQVPDSNTPTPTPAPADTPAPAPAISPNDANTPTFPASPASPAPVPPSDDAATPRTDPNVDGGAPGTDSPNTGDGNGNGNDNNPSGNTLGRGASPPLSSPSPSSSPSSSWDTWGGDSGNSNSDNLQCPGEKVLVIPFVDDINPGLNGNKGAPLQQQQDVMGLGPSNQQPGHDGNKDDQVLVTYCFQVTNIGNTFLFPITLIDRNLDHKQILVDHGTPSLPLAPDDSITFIVKDVPIFQTTRNTVFVTAQPSDSAGNPLDLNPVRDQDSALVIIKNRKPPPKNNIPIHKAPTDNTPPSNAGQKNDGH